MSLSSSKLRALNRRFGQEFGFNPHGQPNFRWVRTESMMRYVDYGGNWTPSTPSGLYLLKKDFKAQSWAERYGRCWILSKWKHYTEEEWFRRVGNSMPYPKQGDWEPVENIRLGPEYPEHSPDPDQQATLDACAAIRAHRERTKRPNFAEEDEAELVADYQKLVKSHTQPYHDRIDDMAPAFDNDPGTHSGSTEFMSGIKENPCPPAA